MSHDKGFWDELDAACQKFLNTTVNVTMISGKPCVDMVETSALTAYAAGDVMSAADFGKVTALYAQWKDKEYTITYYLDGGQNNPGNPATYTVKDTVTLKAPKLVS